jgi:hypothetical protein
VTIAQTAILLHRPAWSSYAGVLPLEQIPASKIPKIKRHVVLSFGPKQELSLMQSYTSAQKWPDTSGTAARLLPLL